MIPFPVLSIITWSPFVGAVLIMFLARHRPLAVRLIALVTTAVSVVLSVFIFVAYEREAAGFQFYEKVPLVPPLGISYELAVDGMSLLMVLLTSIIIFAGVFASWTVATRSQEFYALLLALVTGVYGVFVSLDLFVFFLFYELAVLPMYLLIGIWGSSGEVRPRGIFGWAFRETGVGSKEYAAMKLTLYLLFGSAFILVGIFALYVGAGQRRRSRSSSWRRPAFDPAPAVLGLPRVLRRLRHPGRHLAAAHLVARRARLRADRGLDAARRRADEARRLRRRAAGDGAAARRRRRAGLAGRRHRLHQRRLRRAVGHGPDRPQVRHRLLVRLAHGAGHAGRGHARPRPGSTARCSRCSPTA